MAVSWRVVVSLSHNSAETMNNLTIWTVTGQCSDLCRDTVWFASVDEPTVSEQPFQHVTFCSGNWHLGSASMHTSHLLIMLACAHHTWRSIKTISAAPQLNRIASWGLNNVLALLQARLIWKDCGLSTREIQFIYENKEKLWFTSHAFLMFGSYCTHVAISIGPAKLCRHAKSQCAFWSSGSHCADEVSYHYGVSSFFFHSSVSSVNDHLLIGSPHIMWFLVLCCY